MSRSIVDIFEAFDRGAMTRRQLIQALAAAAVAVPATAFAQGTARAGGAGATADTGRGRGQGRGNAAPAQPLVLPFEPTGWKTVWLDRLEYQCMDYKKAAAFYATLMGWKVRSDNGKEALLDIGENSGGILISGGLKKAPPAAITDQPGHPPVQAVFTGFAWGITPWDEKKVKAELEKRGLKPVADNHGDYKSFRFKDPDDFDVAVTNGTKELRRKTPAKAKLPAPAPFEPTGWNTLYLDHLSFEIDNPRASAAFYQALLGWTMGNPSNTQVSAQIGEGGIVGGAIIRGNANQRARGRGGDSTGRGAAPAKIPAAIGHISWGMENWNTDRVRAELVKRDVQYTNRQGVREPTADMTGSLQSFHVPDAQGWDLQIGNKIGANKYGG